MDKIVYFLRHGQAESNANHFHAGQGDAPLTALGEEQAKNTAPMLSHIKFDKIYCSDLSRAKKTAELALPGQECTYTKQIREIDAGSLTFRYRKDCIAEYGDLYTEHRKKWDYTPFGGEDRDMLYARVAAFMDELAANDEGPTVAVVCHEGPILGAARHAMGKSAQENLLVNNCGVSVFHVTDGKWKLIRWNVTAEKL